jgi:hypothetical protein
MKPKMAIPPIGLPIWGEERAQYMKAQEETRRQQSGERAAAMREESLRRESDPAYIKAREEREERARAEGRARDMSTSLNRAWRNQTYGVDFHKWVMSPEGQKAFGECCTPEQRDAIEQALEKDRQERGRFEDMRKRWSKDSFGKANLPTWQGDDEAECQHQMARMMAKAAPGPNRMEVARLTAEVLVESVRKGYFDHVPGTDTFTRTSKQEPSPKAMEILRRSIRRDLFSLPPGDSAQKVADKYGMDLHTLMALGGAENEDELMAMLAEEEAAPLA